MTDHPEDRPHIAPPLDTGSISWWSRFGAALLLLLVLWIPLAFVPSFIQLQTTSSVYIKDVAFLMIAPVALAIAFASGFFRSSGQQQRRIPLFWIPLILLAFWIVFLLLRASYYEVAVLEARRWLACLAVVASASWLFQNRKAANAAWTLSVIAGGLVAYHGVVQFFEYQLFDWGAFPWALPLRRVCASLGNPNFLGGYLVLSIPLTVSALAARRTIPGRFSLPVAVLAQAILILLCLLRGGSPSIEKLLVHFGFDPGAAARTLLVLLQCLAIASPALALFHFRRKGNLLLYPVFLILCLQVAALGLSFSVGSLGGTLVALLVFLSLRVFYSVCKHGLDRPATRRSLIFLILVLLLVAVLAWPVGSFVGHYREATVKTRLEMYRGTLRMIAERPLTGFGPGMFSVYFPDYRPEDLARYLPPSEHFIDHGHNEYLELTSEYGLAGLALFLAVVLPVLAPALSGCLRGRPDGKHWWLLAGLLGGVTGTLAQNVVSVNLRQISTAAFFWIHLGWAAALLPGGLLLCSRRPGVRRWIFLAASLLVMALAAWNIASVGRNYVGDIHLTKGIASANRSGQEGNPVYRRAYAEQALYYYRIALNLLPGRAQGYYFMGGLQFDLGDYEGALESYRKVRKLERNYVDIVFNLATTLVKLKRYNEALQLYEEALDQNPHYARLNDYYARTLILAGRPEEAKPFRRRAIELLEDKLNLYPADSELYHDLGKNYLFEGQWEKAREYLRKALEMNPANLRYQTSWREYQAIRPHQDKKPFENY